MIPNFWPSVSIVNRHIRDFFTSLSEDHRNYSPTCCPKSIFHLALPSARPRKLPPKYSAHHWCTTSVSLFSNINVSVRIGTKLKLSMAEGTQGHAEIMQTRRFVAIGALCLPPRSGALREIDAKIVIRERAGRQISILNFIASRSSAIACSTFYSESRSKPPRSTVRKRSIADCEIEKNAARTTTGLEMYRYSDDRLEMYRYSDATD